MYCFVNDGDGHWYKIKVSQKQDFEDYCEVMENDGMWEGEEFNQYRCMYPTNYMFKEILVLKEKP